MSHRLRSVMLAVLLALSAVPAVGAPALAAPTLLPNAAPPAADPAFDRLWGRTDQLVRGQTVTNRSWYWVLRMLFCAVSNSVCRPARTCASASS